MGLHVCLEYEEVDVPIVQIEVYAHAGCYYSLGQIDVVIEIVGAAAGVDPDTLSSGVGSRFC